MLLASLLPLNILCCSRKKMSSCLMNNQDSDEEVDLEALRLAALKSRKPKYVKHVNHNNLIPIVPISVETPDFANTKIKVEKLSPPPEAKKQDETKPDGGNKENEEDKASNYSESTLNDQDILSMDDKEEEDSLERLMDQLEAEISGKVPLPTNVVSSKNSSDKKDRRKKSKRSKTDGDDEIELVQVKTGRDCETVIEIRESASPEPVKEADGNKPLSSEQLRSPNRRSRSLIRSRTRSRSPFLRGRSYRRSRSPYWSRSPRRSRSPFRRSRSPFWLSRRSRSRSPLRRYRSPGRKRSPFSRFSRSRSRSFDRRRPSWSLSPRRSKSPYYRDSLPPRRNFNSPPGRVRRSFSPRDGSKSPRRRSRSPRGFTRNSPFRRSKSPFRRSRSPFRRTKSLTRRSQSPFSHRSKSPISKLNSPLPKRSPPGRLTPPKHSKSPARRSLSVDRRPKSSERASPKLRSKSPPKYEGPRRSPRHLPPKDMRNSKSPTSRRVRSPLRAVNERNDKPRDRNRNEKRHRSLSRENHKTHDRRPYRSRLRRFSPGNRNRKSADKDLKNNKSPKGKDVSEKSKEETLKQSPKDNTGPSIPLDPVLEARKKKFENLNVVDPTVDKKISLKSIKESTENVEEDEDALTINVEGNLWDESEESEDEFESRFKSGEAKKGRTVLSFRSLRENDAASRKVILNKPLVEDNRGKSDGGDRWLGRRNDRWRNRHYDGSRNRVDDNDTNRNRFRDNDKSNVQSNTNTRTERRSDRKPIVWSSRGERKRETESKANNVTTTQSEVKEDKSKNSVKPSSGSGGGGGGRDKVGKVDSDLPESDDFDKLISDFERELESDICLSTKDVNSATSSVSQGDVKKSKISLKNSLEPQTSVDPAHKKHSGMRTVRATETCLSRLDKAQEEDLLTSLLEDNNGTEAYTSEDNKEGPEDYIEDDDFFLEDSTEKKRSKVDDEEDGQSDLRTVLSKRRNQRLTKVVSLQENMPTRLVQSAFQGLGNKKPKRHFRETQNPLEFSPVDRNVKSAGAEGRRVLLLQRDRNPSMPAVKCTVPEVRPDTTIYQRCTPQVKRRKRKLQRQPDPNEDLDQEEEEEGFEMEEERQSRRFRLKRNVTLSSQYGISGAQHQHQLFETFTIAITSLVLLL